MRRADPKAQAVVLLSACVLNDLSERLEEEERRFRLSANRTPVGSETQIRYTAIARLADRDLSQVTDALERLEGSATLAEMIEAPGGRATHALLNVLQVLMTWSDQPAEGRDDAIARAVASLEGVVLDVAAMQEYIEVQERNIATMAEESNQTHRELTHEREKATGAVAALRETSGRLAAYQRETELFHAELAESFGDFAQLLRRSQAIKELDVESNHMYHDAPRAVAAGRH